jgi:hypothetical protein
MMGFGGGVRRRRLGRGKVWGRRKGRLGKEHGRGEGVVQLVGEKQCVWRGQGREWGGAVGEGGGGGRQVVEVDDR